MSSGVQLQSQGKWEKTVNGTILNQSTSVWEEIPSKLKDLYQMGEGTCTSHYQWGDYYLESSKSLTTKKPMKNMNRRVRLWSSTDTYRWQTACEKNVHHLLSSGKWKSKPWHTPAKMGPYKKDQKQWIWQGCGELLMGH